MPGSVPHRSGDSMPVITAPGVTDPCGRNDSVHLTRHAVDGNHRDLDLERRDHSGYRADPVIRSTSEEVFVVTEG